MRKRDPKVKIGWGTSRKPIDEISDLGAAWLHASQALVKVKEVIPKDESAPVLIANAIVTGKLRVFTDYLAIKELEPETLADDDFDDWVPSGILSTSQVKKMGFADPDQIGPAYNSYALTLLTWSNNINLLRDVNDWNWRSNKFTIHRRFDDEQTRCLTIHNVVFSALEIDALLRLHDLKVIAGLPPDFQNLGGRPRGGKWADWTAYLVAHYHEEGIAPNVDVGEIAARIDEQMAFAGLGKIDRRDAKKVIEKVEAHLRHNFGKPQKS
jgi:hypothetical protein